MATSMNSGAGLRLTRPAWKLVLRSFSRGFVSHQLPDGAAALTYFAALALAPSVASAAWTVSPTPSVEGADVSSLQAVDCSSANSCIAVGSSVSFSGLAEKPLAERWDGTSWQIVPTPDLGEDGRLSGVSCPWPRFCFAVGTMGEFFQLHPPPLPPVPLVEVWNGTSWSVQSTPPSPGELEAVSCSGLLACTAVGSRRLGPFPPFNTYTLALRWEPAALGAGWHD
ncbi:MAG: hypothetical protein ABWX98_07190, partial [Lacisediminihabitans sp.]